MKIMDGFKNGKVKALFAKAALAGLIAGAAFMASPAKANAQVAVGIHFGHRPVYVGPVYAGPAPYYAAPPAYVAPAYGYYGYGGRFYDRRYGWDHRDRRFR